MLSLREPIVRAFSLTPPISDGPPLSKPTDPLYARAQTFAGYRVIRLRQHRADLLEVRLSLVNNTGDTTFSTPGLLGKLLFQDGSEEVFAEGCPELELPPDHSTAFDFLLELTDSTAPGRGLAEFTVEYAASQQTFAVRALCHFFVIAR